MQPVRLLIRRVGDGFQASGPCPVNATGNRHAQRFAPLCFKPAALTRPVQLAGEPLFDGSSIVSSRASPPRFVQHNQGCLAVQGSASFKPCHPPRFVQPLACCTQHVRFSFQAVPPLPGSCNPSPGTSGPAPIHQALNADLSHPRHANRLAVCSEHTWFLSGRPLQFAQPSQPDGAACADLLRVRSDHLIHAISSPPFPVWSPLPQ